MHTICCAFAISKLLQEDGPSSPFVVSLGTKHSARQEIRGDMSLKARLGASRNSFALQPWMAVDLVASLVMYRRSVIKGAKSK